MVKNAFGFALFSLFLLLFGTVITQQLPTEQPVFALFLPSDDLNLLLLQSYTLPRICIALLAGGILGLASLLLQQVMNNPLASDNTLGISAGAQFSLFLCAIFAPHWLNGGASFIALIGATLSLLLVLTLAMRKTISPLLLILAGLVVNLYFGSFSAMLMLFYPEESRGLAQWGAGSLVQESWHDSQLLALQAIIPLGLIALLQRPLSLLSLNDANAQSLGVPVAKLRLLGVLISSFLIACVISRVGMIGFVGLAAATVVRQLGVRQFKHQLLAAFGLGALLLGITDLALQLVSQHIGTDLPTGAVTSLLGTPLLLWLMFNALPHTGRLVESGTRISHRFKPQQAVGLLLFFVILLLFALSLGKGADGWQIRFDSELLALRSPRLMFAIAVGILLGVAGTLLQRLTQNPMASPELLGVSSGTSMGILLVLFVFSAEQSGYFWLAGILGALVALLVLMAINQRNGMLPEKVLLTGISLSALFDTLQRLAIASGSPKVSQLISWLSGSTQQTNSEFALPFLVLSLLLLAISLLFHRWLSLLSLNAVNAQALGLNVGLARLVLIVFSAILTALATLIIGPLSFIGLLVPHMSRFLGVIKPITQLLISALLGAMLMLAADWLGRQLLFPYEIPAGLVATLIGGSYFLLMVRRV